MKTGAPRTHELPERTVDVGDVSARAQVTFVAEWAHHRGSNKHDGALGPAFRSRTRHGGEPVAGARIERKQGHAQ